MIYRIIAAIILTAIATSLGEWTGYIYTSYAFAAIGSIRVLRAPPAHPLFEVTSKDRKNMRSDFEALEIAAWLARPAILILDKHRSTATSSEIALLYQYMNSNMASVVGPEKEIIRYLHAIATVPMRPQKSIERYARLAKSRFGAKRAKNVREIFINAAAHLLVRVNCPDRALTWYLINAYRINVDVENALEAVLQRYQQYYKHQRPLALTEEDYPSETLDGTGINLPVPDELKNNDRLLTLMEEVATFRRYYSETAPETDQQQYDRIMRPVVEAEEQIRDILMYG